MLTTASAPAAGRAPAANASWGSGLPAAAAGAPAATASLFQTVSAFRALLPRHDLHVAPDCTHFCYTPLVWAPVWSDAARALDAVLEARRAAA